MKWRNFIVRDAGYHGIGALTHVRRTNIGISILIHAVEIILYRRSSNVLKWLLKAF